jgi:hypothetical protein
VVVELKEVNEKATKKKEVIDREQNERGKKMSGGTKNVNN